MVLPDGLSVGERRLWEAFVEGRALDLRAGDPAHDAVRQAGQWGPERHIRAEVVARLAHGEAQLSPVRSAVLRLRGARITGTLGLQHVRSVGPLLFEECAFDRPLDVTHAEIPSFSLEGSRVPGVEGYGLRIEGDLNLSEVVAGAVRLFGARIEGRIWLVGAHLSCLDGYALDAPDMVLQGGLYCRGCIAEGGVNLYGSAVAAGMEFDDARLTNPRGFALRAHNAVFGSDVSCINSVLAGGMSLFGAEIGGQLWLNGASLENREGWALDAPNMTVRGGLYGRGGMNAGGGVNLYGSVVGAGMEFDGAQLTGRHGPALRAPHLTVAGDLSCADGFSAKGGIVLAGARIDGQLSFRGADLGGPRPVTLDCADAKLGELALDRLASSPEVVLLTGTTARTIHDDSDFCPQHLELDHARYDTLRPHLPARERLAWLTRGQGDYQPARYEQLAAYYRRLGHEEEARTVLLAKQRHRRTTLHLPARLWGWMQEALVGYGYRPVRSFGWLALGIAVTTCYFAAFPPTPSGGAKGPEFVALAYAADVFLPVLDLGQQRAFTAHGVGQWVVWGAVVAGWVLATAVIAGVTRALSRT